MSMRMLIDARHPEETRVAVVKGNRIEEFDFESAEHKQLKGNIYLAKVTRVEPSLQFPLATATRVSSGWRASISMRMDIENSPGAPSSRETGARHN